MADHSSTVDGRDNDCVKQSLLEIMPRGYSYQLASGERDGTGGFRAVIKLQCSNADECDKWVAAFSTASGCTWRVRRTYPGGRRGRTYRKDYVCQHASFNKRHATQSRRVTKDAMCGATMSIKVTECNRWNRHDRYMAQGLVCTVSLVWVHSHSLTSARVLSYRPAQCDVKSVFDSYFEEGMTPAGAMQFHRTSIEMAPNFREEDLADGSKNPPPRAVYYWHDLWRKVNLGGRSGQPMMEKLKAKVEIWQQTCSSKVAVQDEPFAVAILTPIMARAHVGQWARDVCFVDSTASCDAENHAITFMLTPTVAGAVPLAVIVTDSTSTASYVAGFKLLKSILPDNAFGGQGFPSVFVTDDSDAERSALHECWPAAVLRLCLFHVAQAMWRWLWAEKNKVHRADRQVLMTEFQCIMYATSIHDAETAYDDAHRSGTADEYENYRLHLERWWERRELWCLAWRTEQQRGHHTNNFAEVTVRLYKDVVLGRAKAYNVVAVVDFTVRVMEQYYRTRLRDFANGRVSAQRLLAEKLQSKASYLVSCDQIESYGEGKYGVPNSDGTELYCVNASLGCCSCYAGLFGKFCKHQLAVMQLFKTAFPNAPGTSPASRHGIAYIALGDCCPPAEFYSDLVVNGPADVSLLTMNAATVPSLDIVQQPETRTAEVSDVQAQSIEGPLPDTDLVLADAIAALQQKYSEYGHAPGCQSALQKFTARVNAVRSSSSLCSLFHNTGLYRRYRAGSMIRVQPTSLSRRQVTVTRGSRKLPAGRPPLACSGPARKCRRCLAANVRANLPNAKSHGMGH